MDRWPKLGWRAYWGLTLLVLGVGAVMAIRAPLDPVMGPIQKLIYLHLPVAANTFVAAMMVCVASVGTLWGRRRMWDELARAAANVTLLNGTILLITGVCWAKVAWGVWWTWSPRLTFSLILWSLYAVYLVLRSRIESEQRRTVVCAVYGIVAFLDVPLLYLSAKLLPDVHPTGSGLASMYSTLWVWFAGMTLLSVGLIVARFVVSLATLDPFDDDEQHMGTHVRMGAAR